MPTVSQKKRDDKMDSMKIQLHRNILQLPVCSQDLPPAPSTSRLLQMLQLKHLHCVSQRENDASPHSPKEGRRRCNGSRSLNAAQISSPTYRPELIAVVNPTTWQAELTSANRAKRNLRADRTSRGHESGTLTEQINWGTSE